MAFEERDELRAEVAKLKFVLKATLETCTIAYSDGISDDELDDYVNDAADQLDFDYGED